MESFANRLTNIITELERLGRVEQAQILQLKSIADDLRAYQAATQAPALVHEPDA